MQCLSRELFKGHDEALPRVSSQNTSFKKMGLQGASAQERRRAVKYLITRWCKAIVQNECDAFETEWLLGGAIVETPTKRRRQCSQASVAEPDSQIDVNSTAVADDYEIFA